MARSVFSGASALAPRCPTVRGRAAITRTPLLAHDAVLSFAHSGRTLAPQFAGRRTHEQASNRRACGSFGVPRVTPAVPGGDGRLGGGCRLQHDARWYGNASTGGERRDAEDGGVDDRSGCAVLL